jgi:hypothetical protein
VIKEVFSFSSGVESNVDMTAPYAGADNIFRVGRIAAALATWPLCCTVCCGLEIVEGRLIFG